MAAAAGFAVTGTVTDQVGLDETLPVILGDPGPVFYTIKVRAEALDFVLPPNDGTELRDRMRNALLGSKA
mgnify:CR=1 FL=1